MISTGSSQTDVDLLALRCEIVIFYLFILFYFFKKISECILHEQAVPVLIKEMGAVFQVLCR